eukprot:COSAG01_NODE_7_length_54400_cov_1218.054935_19_plen_568_part_00
MSTKPPAKRLLVFYISLLCIGLILIARLGYLQLLQHSHYNKKATRQLKRIIPLNPHRGNIYTKELETIAMMKESYSIFAIPKEVTNNKNTAQQLEKILGIPKEKIYKKLKRKTHFVWLKRHCNKTQKTKIEHLNIKGLNFITESTRTYPKNNFASHIIGISGIDNQGLSGLEYSQNKHLKGNPGKLILERDPRGQRLITGKELHYEANHGGHIILTLDYYTQHISEKFLQEGVEKYQAQKGYVVVLKPKTGEILAMATYPNFDPNHWQQYPDQVFSNPCISTVFEPGSVLKCMTIAMALEEKSIAANSVLHVPRALNVYKHRITEAHEAKKDEPYEKSILEILKFSSNVGAALIAQKHDKHTLYHYLKKFGFGKKINTGLPGESKGLLRPPKQWSGIDLEMHAFGQGLAVTPLQLAAAMNVFANNGNYIKPYIIKEKSNANFNSIMKHSINTKHPVISESTLNKIKPMLASVVDGGTAWPVKIKGYKISGKTGTAQKAKENGRGYQKGNYMATFVGFLPYKDPQALIAVILDSPQTSIYGGHTSGIIFRNIAQALSQHYHYPPDIEN